MYQVGEHIQVTFGWFKNMKGIVVSIGHEPIEIKEVKRDLYMNVYLYSLFEIMPKWVKDGKTFPFFHDHVEILEPLAPEFFLTHHNPAMRELGIKFSEIQHAEIQHVVLES